MGFPRQQYWNGFPFLSPGIEPKSPALVGIFFTTEPPGKPTPIFTLLLFWHHLTFFFLPLSFRNTKGSEQSENTKEKHKLKMLGFLQNESNTLLSIPFGPMTWVREIFATVHTSNHELVLFWFRKILAQNSLNKLMFQSLLTHLMGNKLLYDGFCIFVLYCLLCTEVSDVIDYKVEPWYDCGSREDKEANKEKRNKNMSHFLRPDVLTPYFESWKILLGSKTYLEKEYYNFKQMINVMWQISLLKQYFVIFIQYENKFNGFFCGHLY